MTRAQVHHVLVAAGTQLVTGQSRPEAGVTRLRIRVEGQTYDVEVEVLPDAIDLEPDVPMPDSLGHPAPLPDIREQDKICRSPIAGVIVKVLAEAGQPLRQDEGVAVIEAMKMQTTIGAPVDGTVAEIHVAAGQAVKPGQPICTMI